MKINVFYLEWQPFIRATCFYMLMSFFGKGRSHKMVAMVTRKRLSLIFFFRNVDYRFIGKVTKFQEKIFIRSRVIIEKPRGGPIRPPTPNRVKTISE